MDVRPARLARRPWLAVLVALLLMLGLGGWVGWQWRTLEEGAEFEQRRRFEGEVDHIEHRLRERMRAYEMVLRGLSGLTGLNDQMSPDEWTVATDRLLLLETYPGIHAVNFAYHLSRNDVLALTEYLRRSRPDFHVWPDSDGQFHVVVEYTHPPLWRNLQILGFDLLTESVRRQALLRARDTGYATLTGPLRLIQDSSQSGQAGILLFLPIYRSGAPAATLTERQQAFIGTLYGAFRLDDLVQGVLSERLEQFDIQLFDAAEPGLPLLRGQMQYASARYKAERAIELYGRRWQLLVASTPDYEATLGGDDRRFGLFAGLTAAALFSLLVGGYLILRERALSESRIASERLREREARFRLLLEKLPVATLLCGRSGEIELANQSAANLLGASVDELVGHRVNYYLPGVLEGGELLMLDSETQAQRQDGEKVPVTLHVTPLSQPDHLHCLFNLVDLRAFKLAEERFRDVVEGLPNAFVLANAEGRIVMVNRQTEQLFGYPREELLGEPVERLLPESLRDGHAMLRAGFLQQAEPYRIGNNREVFGLHRDGRQIPLEVGLAPLRSGDEMLVQAVLIDITHRKAAELRLRDQADQLTVANRYKSEFLANMSHELRTPLNSILILSDQLRQNAEGNLSVKQMRHAGIIQQAGKDLLQMINDVLDLSRIETGRLQLALGPVDLEALLEETAEAMRPLAEEKGLRLGVSVAPDAPQRFVSDRARLQQILRNLLSNAVKFTERGEVEIVARCKPFERTDPCRYLQLQVRDTGIGIPEQDRQRIFEAFQQIDGSISRNYGGAGLGLAIARQLVEVFRGRISLESSEGSGSCFTVELPLDAESELPGPVPEAELLVLTDNPRCAAQIEDVGQTHGLLSEQFDSAEQAIEAARRLRLKAVFIDFEDDETEGWALYQALRGDPRHHDVPVIVMANRLQAENWHDGALHYVKKPLEHAALQRFCGQLARRQSQLERLLMVEPELDKARELRSQFERLGYSVTLCRRSDEARLAFAAQEYRALVVDFDLPAGEGRDLLDALNRLRPLNQGVKVIVYSRNGLSEAELEQLPVRVSALPRSGSEERMEAILRPHEGEQRPAGDAAGRPLLGRKVLLFDTEVRSIFLLSGQLDGLGLQSTPATSMSEALARFEEAAFDLVLISMGQESEVGDLVRRLREEHGCQVPILGLAEPDCSASRSLGLDDCLVRPVEPGILAAFIQRWLDRRPDEAAD